MKSKIRAFHSAVAVAVLCAVGTATVSAVGNRTLVHLEMMFTKADKNTDGEVTKEEVKAVDRRMSDKKTDDFFARNDKDGNGTLNKDEFTANATERVKGAEKVGKPNIIHIMVDEPGYFEAGFMGNKLLHTPKKGKTKTKAE